MTRHVKVNFLLDGPRLLILSNPKPMVTIQGIPRLKRLRFKFQLDRQNFVFGTLWARYPRGPGFESSLARFPGVSCPGFKVPSLETPGFKPPNLETPSFKVSNLEAPGFQGFQLETPGFKVSNLETAGFKVLNLDAPGFQGFKLETPGFKVPSVETPGFQAPNLETPGFKISSLEIGRVPLSFPTCFRAWVLDLSTALRWAPLGQEKLCVFWAPQPAPTEYTTCSATCGVVRRPAFAATSAGSCAFVSVVPCARLRRGAMWRARNPDLSQGTHPQVAGCTTGQNKKSTFDPPHY